MSASYLLRDAVERAIMTYHPIRTSETKIEIDVQGRDIILKGYVRTDVMRYVASQLAKDVAGVKTVRNHLFSDTSLEIMVGQMIDNRLGSYIVPMMPIVRAIRGHVFLRGPVPSQKAKEIIEETASQLPGIIQVHNLLDVDSVAVERLVAPKKMKAVGAEAGDASKQAIEAEEEEGRASVLDLNAIKEQYPAWAILPPQQWGAKDFEEVADARVAELKGKGQPIKEIRQAAQDALETAKRDKTIASGGMPKRRELTPEEIAAIRQSLEGEHPAWALKAKEEWAQADFKAQMQAKRAFKKEEGEDPDVIIQKAQEAFQKALQAASQALALQATMGQARELTPEEIAAIRQSLEGEHPAWALKAKEEWDKADFKAQMQAKRAFKKEEGEDPEVIIQKAQEALQKALQAASQALALQPTMGQARELTPEEIAAIRQSLEGEHPAWALKAKEEWDKADFKAQMQAKRAFKKDEGEDPEVIIQKAQAALQEALEKAKRSPA